MSPRKAVAKKAKVLPSNEGPKTEESAPISHIAPSSDVAKEETPPFAGGPFPDVVVYLIGGDGGELADMADRLPSGYMVPLTHRLAVPGQSPSDRARLAMRHLMRADAVALLPGFSRSRESALELMASQAMGIPLVALDDLLDGATIAEAARPTIKTGVVMSGELVTADRVAHRATATFEKFAPIVPQTPTDPVHDSAGPNGQCTACGNNHLRPDDGDGVARLDVINTRNDT